eukprot:3787319-Amphidinium_carterae.2
MHYCHATLAIVVIGWLSGAPRTCVPTRLQHLRLGCGLSAHSLEIEAGSIKEARVQIPVPNPFNGENWSAVRA